MSSYWKRFSVLAFFAFCISCYLVFHFTEISRGFQEEKSFCTLSAAIDCDAIAKSSYSLFLGQPVAGWALIYYLLLLTLIVIVTQPERDEKTAANVLFFFISLALVPTLWLLAVSHFVLHTYCLVCLTLDVANILLFLLSFYCPARKDPMLRSFSSGAKDFFRLWISPPFKKTDGSLLSPSLYLWAVLIAGLLSLNVVPEALVRHYFLPRRLQRSDLSYLKPLLDIWKENPIHQVAVNREGSPLERDFVIGSPNAPVTIVEFSDFECPFCKRTAQFLKPFILGRQKDFQFVFKNFPLDQSCNRMIKQPKHQFACRAAIMARCAGAESDEKFWKMHDTLMDMSEFTDEALKAVPEQSGLHVGAFETCLNEPNILQRLKEDIDQGAVIRVRSTPTILVNGKKIVAAPPYLPGLLELILKEVKAGGTPPGNPTREVDGGGEMQLSPVTAAPK